MTIKNLSWCNVRLFNVAPTRNNNLYIFNFQFNIDYSEKQATIHAHKTNEMQKLNIWLGYEMRLDVERIQVGLNNGVDFKLI